MNSNTIKRILGSITLGVVLFCQTTYASGYGNVNVNNLNVRNKATTSSNVVNQVGKSNYLHILDKPANGWYAIETNTDKLGYVSAKYVDIQKAKGIVNATSVNVRKKPDYNAPVVSQFNKQQSVYAYSQTGDWYLVQTGDIKGYIHRDYIDGLLIDRLPNKMAASTNIQKPTEKTIAVAKTTINLRKKPSTSSDIVGKVTPATVVDVKTIHDKWVNVTMSDNKQGYLAKEYLNIGKESAKAKLVKGISTNKSSNGKTSNLISYAKNFIGNPYVYGGNSLTRGVDCSGFTSQVFKNFGVSLNRSSASQYSNNGTHINTSQARPGDLMFYGYSGHVSHVGIYIGNGQIIHASDSSTGICIGNAFRTTGKPLIGAKRVL